MREEEAKIAAIKFAQEMCIATRETAIEECAKVAERLFLEATDTEWDEGVNTAKREIAKRIRALNSNGGGK